MVPGVRTGRKPHPPCRRSRGVNPMRTVLVGAVPLLLVAGLLACAEEKKADAQGQALFNGKDLTGWKLIDPKAADRSKWSVAGGVKLKADVPAQLEPEPGT